MMLLGFTFSSFMFAMNREPRFKGIGIDKCRTMWKSYPNGMSEKDVDYIFTNHRNELGSVFFQRDSTIFMMDVEEKEVVLRVLMSNEYDIGRFCSAYFDVKDRVEKIGGTFVDKRFPGSS